MSVLYTLFYWYLLYYIIKMYYKRISKNDLECFDEEWYIEEIDKIFQETIKDSEALFDVMYENQTEALLAETSFNVELSIKKSTSPAIEDFKNFCKRQLLKLKKSDKI